jgi:hypothetical protein
VHRPKQLEAGPFAADVASFRLHLAAENKAAGTVRTYTEAALTSVTSWEGSVMVDEARSSGVVDRTAGAAARANNCRIAAVTARGRPVGDGAGDAFA